MPFFKIKIELIHALNGLVLIAQKRVDKTVDVIKISVHKAGIDQLLSCRGTSGTMPPSTRCVKGSTAYSTQRLMACPDQNR